jgi:DNA-directed RNA polymerase alpha subunit
MIDHIEERRRLEAVVAAARTGDRTLIKLALHHLDQLRGTGDLSVRTTMVLKKRLGDDLTTWPQALSEMTEGEILLIPDMGRKGLQELKEWLADQQLSFKAVPK